MMFAYLTGRGRSKTLATTASTTLALCAALCAGGCAADSSSYYANSAAVAGYVAQVDRVEIEDDGLPAQAAPSLRIRQLPDDPFEPYSSNYGGANPASRRPVPSTLS